MVIIFPRFYHRLDNVHKELFKPVNNMYSVIKVNHPFFVRTGIGEAGPLINGKPGDYLVCMDNKLISVWRQDKIECLN